jgi:hypothetical protein
MNQIPTLCYLGLGSHLRPDAYVCTCLVYICLCLIWVGLFDQNGSLHLRCLKYVETYAFILVSYNWVMILYCIQFGWIGKCLLIRYVCPCKKRECNLIPYPSSWILFPIVCTI